MIELNNVDRGKYGFITSAINSETKLIVMRSEHTFKTDINNILKNFSHNRKNRHMTIIINIM